ncbi:MAG: GNAT family N-acetyltransferase [Myxococcota bacterium]
MTTDLLALAQRLERAQALQNERITQAAGGKSLAVGRGFAHFRGDGHPLNQALGLLDPLTEATVEALERFLGAPTVLELSPAADAALWPLLARRGYRVHQFQQLWVRALSSAAGLTIGPEVRRVASDEAETWNRVVSAGFQELDDWRAHEPLFRTSLEVTGVFGYLALVDGEPAAGGLLGVVDGVALLSGDAVLPRFRGRGLQKQLIHARLRHALTLGCDVACAGTAPLTASQRSYEACGFRVAYPKLELARG